IVVSCLNGSRRSTVSTLVHYTTLFRSGPDEFSMPLRCPLQARVWLPRIDQCFGKANLILGVEPLQVCLVNLAGGGFAFHGRSWQDRKSTRLNSSHVKISYAVFCLKKKN